MFAEVFPAVVAVLLGALLDGPAIAVVGGFCEGASVADAMSADVVADGPEPSGVALRDEEPVGVELVSAESVSPSEGLVLVA